MAAMGRHPEEVAALIPHGAEFASSQNANYAFADQINIF